MDSQQTVNEVTGIENSALADIPGVTDNQTNEGEIIMDGEVKQTVSSEVETEAVPENQTYTGFEANQPVTEDAETRTENEAEVHAEVPDNSDAGAAVQTPEGKSETKIPREKIKDEVQKHSEGITDSQLAKIFGIINVSRVLACTQSLSKKKEIVRIKKPDERSYRNYPKGTPIPSAENTQVQSDLLSEKSLTIMKYLKHRTGKTEKELLEEAITDLDRKMNPVSA